MLRWPMLSLRVFTARRYFQLCSRLSTDRYYTKKHEWVSVNGDVGTVGITDFAAGQLGDVVYVECPEVDSEVEKGNCAGAVESVKAASDMYTPLSGTIIEINEELLKDSSLINKSPFEKGWMFKLRIKSSDELKSLLDQSQYDKFKKEEEAEH